MWSCMTQTGKCELEWGEYVYPCSVWPLYQGQTQSLRTNCAWIRLSPFVLPSFTSSLKFPTLVFLALPFLFPFSSSSHSFLLMVDVFESLWIPKWASLPSAQLCILPPWFWYSSGFKRCIFLHQTWPHALQGQPTGSSLNTCNRLLCHTFLNLSKIPVVPFLNSLYSSVLGYM